MEKKVGRNDPCPCGSGKKYKSCHMLENPPNVRKKIKATVISGGGISKAQKQPPDLMQRTFGNAIAAAEKEEKPPARENMESKES